MTDAQIEQLVALVQGLADIIIDTYVSERGAAAQSSVVQCAA